MYKSGLGTPYYEIRNVPNGIIILSKVKWILENCVFTRNSKTTLSPSYIKYKAQTIFHYQQIHADTSVTLP